MKYPDGFLTYKSGPSPVGQHGKRALDAVNTPYLTQVAGGTVTRKKNGFTETSATGGTPSLVGYVLTNDNAYHLAFVDVDAGATIRDTKFIRFPKMDGNAASLPLCRLVYAGDGYLLSMANDANNYDGETWEYVTSWPTLLRANTSVKQRTSGEDASVAQGVSFIDSITIAGMLSYYHDFGLHATGWGGEAERYRYSFSCTYFTDSEKPLESRVPIFFTGNTKSQNLTQVAYPYYPGRDHPGGKTFVIGKGRLQQFVFVTEAAVADLATKALIYPYFANSVDHGSSWSSATAEFIRPFLYKHPLTPMVPANPAAEPPTPEIPEVRAYLDSAQLSRMQDNHLNVYLGDGKSMIVIPNGYVSDDGEGNHKTCCMAFLGSDGSGYSRISWPADDWEFDNLMGEPTAEPGSYVAVFRQLKDHYSAQLGFGVGCMYLPIKHEGAQKFLVTWNFGSTWAIKDYPARPVGMTAGSLSESGAVIKPYVSAEEPGEIIFACPNLATGRIDFLRTTGLFDGFKKTAGVIRMNEPLGTQGPQLYYQTGEPNQHFTYFGGAKKSYINPAFPGEFDKP